MPMSDFAELWQTLGEIQGIVETCKLSNLGFGIAVDSILKLIPNITQEEAETQVKKYWN